MQHQGLILVNKYASCGQNNLGYHTHMLVPKINPCYQTGARDRINLHHHMYEPWQRLTQVIICIYCVYGDD